MGRLLDQRAAACACGLASALSLAAGLAACSSGVDLYLPSPPEVAAAQTVVVYIADPDGGSALVARADAPAWELALDRGGASTVELAAIVAYYAEPASELDLPLGPLPAAETEARSCRLNAPIAVRSRRSSDATVAWAEDPPELPDDMSMHVVGDGSTPCLNPDLCETFDRRVVRLPGSSVVRFILPLDDDSVLVSDAQAFWRVYGDGRFEKKTAMTGLPGSGAALTSDGRIHLGGRRGEVALGRLDEPFEIETVLTGTGAAVLDLDIDPTGAEVAVGLRRVEEREQVVLLLREASRWREVGALFVDEASTLRIRVRWVAANQALATYGGQSLLLLKDGALREQIVGFNNPLFELEINAVTRHPTLGALFAANDGRVYAAAAPYDSWLAIEGAQLEAEAQVVEAYRDGFVFGGPDGFLRQFVPGSAECPDDYVVDANTTRVAVVGDRIFAGGAQREAGFDNSVTILTPRR